MHSQRELSFFFTMRTRAAWEEVVGWIKPVFRFSLMKVWRVESLTGDSEYSVPKGGEVPSSRSIFRL